MNQFQKIYYRGVCAIIPNIFFILALWTSYDLFLSSIVMVMLFYLMMTLYYFQVEDNDLNNLIRVKIEDLVFIENKNEPFYTGYFFSSLLGLLTLIVVFKFSELPVYLPLPQHPPISSAIIYGFFVAVFFGIGLQLISNLFYKVFVSKITRPQIAILLESLLEIQVVFFFTNRLVLLIPLAILSITKNVYSTNLGFAKSTMMKIGFSFGLISVLGTMLIVSLRYPLVQAHPKNYWRF
jgi:hypothetical protein